MIEEHRDMLNDLLEVDEGLSAWEVTFIDDLDHLPEEQELTETQGNKLKQIWKEHCND